MVTPNLSPDTKRPWAFTRVGALGRVTLGRADNAIDSDFFGRLVDSLSRWARDPDVYAVVLQSDTDRVFSAGADLVERLGLVHDNVARADVQLAAEARAIWLLDCFTKPSVSLMDGAVLGSAAGLTLCGTHRVAGEDYRFAIPSTAQGLVPEAGLARVLAHMPDGIGLYLALTGRSLDRADAFALGLVTHCIPKSRFGAIIDGLAAADVIDPLLDGLHVDPGAGSLPSYRAVIARCFAVGSVADILARLDAEQSDGRDWAADVARDIRLRSPFALTVATELIQRAATCDLRAMLLLEQQVLRHCVRHHDFAEGVRCSLVARGAMPRWAPASHADISAVSIARVFEPLDGATLELKPRAALQTDML